MSTSHILDDLTDAIARSRASGVSPFREYLEAPSVIVELYQQFGRKLNDASDARHTDELVLLLDDLELAVDKARALD